MLTTNELTYGKSTWCPGCGHYAVLNAIQRAVIELGLKKEETVCVSGIGCSSKLPEYLDVYGFHTMHGRSLPHAQGVKLANPELTVINVGGDGDGFAIGCGHFVHAARRNVDITYILMNNQIYSLTKGQTSPTSDRGFITKTSPEGAEEAPVNTLLMALTAGATFVGCGFSSEVTGLGSLIASAVKHKGFSFINVMSPCVTFNKLNTYDSYKKQSYKFEETTGYDPQSYEKAIEAALGYFERKPLGLLFKTETSVFKEVHMSEHPIAPAMQDISDPKKHSNLMERYLRH
ncbi:MAG: hypothetical protein A2008_10370 [Candidatus Wallbacteria bacterium GWC2_49_35]|uniref:2-oxoacid ferredoxin oxidoreductase n=1 Tax=Candidatus Wallbacteria bacterium GWC2_49_35 TaxID=1817813 RepID=A0A1F7WPX1_9BACT|nr:MAG: hypothetical protein A2008_10370 [Candidatus Wallbacteria bacterium GWC2_49_35]